jgi:hypothetical protein
MLFSFLDICLSFGSGFPEKDKKEKRQEKTGKESSADSGSFGRGDKIFSHLANHNLSIFQPIDVSHIFVADKHEQPQLRRRRKSPKDNVVIQVYKNDMMA